MNVLQGALLGLVQGLGEFLPVSSSGHLLLARFLLGIQNAAPDVQASYKVLDILLHVGTLIPLVIVFWKDGSFTVERSQNCRKALWGFIFLQNFL